METLLLVLGAIVVFGAGCGLGFFLSTRQDKGAELRAEKAEADLAAYRNDVADHFRETAGHFQAMGQQYRALHDHLAQGADRLCGVPGGPRVGFSPLGELESPTVVATSSVAAATASDSEHEVSEPEPAATAEVEDLSGQESLAEATTSAGAEDAPAEPAEEPLTEREPPKDFAVESADAVPPETEDDAKRTVH